MIWPAIASLLRLSKAVDAHLKIKKPHIRRVIYPTFMLMFPVEPAYWYAWECTISGAWSYHAYGISPKDAYDQWVKAGGSPWPPTIELR